MVRVDGGVVGVVGGGRGDTRDHGGGGGAQGLSVQGGHVAALHPVQITTHVCTTSRWKPAASISGCSCVPIKQNVDVEDSLLKKTDLI